MVLQFIFKLYGEQCEFIENGADFNSKFGIVKCGESFIITGNFDFRFENAIFPHRTRTIAKIGNLSGDSLLSIFSHR